MSLQKLLPVLTVICISFSGTRLAGQETVSKSLNAGAVIDSLHRAGYITAPVLKKDSIVFTKEMAEKFLQDKYKAGNWVNYTDPFRQAIGQVLYYYAHNPFDSLKAYLNRYPYDSIDIPWERFFEWDTVKVKIPHSVLRSRTATADSVARIDSLVTVNADTIAQPAPGFERLIVYRDSLVRVISDTLYGVLPYSQHHIFNVYRYPFQSDSISAALKTLTDLIDARDSSLVRFREKSGSELEVWRNSKSGRLHRYWLKNEYNDSVTVWIGAVGRNTFGLFLEEGIMFRRPAKQSNFSDAQLTLKQINSNKLQDVNKIYVKPDYWKYRSEASFVLNQASLTNWVKGGESSISTSMDITGYATYNNKKRFLSSSNFARIKYGLVASGDKGIRKNLDLIETNSKLNHKAFGKFDFSATMLFKTQVAKGFNYTKINGKDTALLVSRFFNPATLTIGLGLDYKPNKTTSINFAPLTYKGTFVTDTTGKIGLDAIDQTKYGIPKGKKSLHEPGVSLLFSNETKLYKNITVTNRVQLFTSYIHNPQNIDIDWEMIATARLNWFTDVRLNTHFIFDDDTKTPVVDSQGNPVLGPDGKQKKTARIQFKEILGFSFVFRF